ncbi:MAG: peptidoglycan-binding protein [Acidobacteria bacterium]|nr:peptidoglycan-binding protein [Acidobacteriota bacterium]
MTRIYFQKPMKGYRAVRGELVRRMQRALQVAGVGPADSDGIFGTDTAKAVAAFQQRQGVTLPAKTASWRAGQVDGPTWEALTGECKPGLLDRCLQITADFEGHGFGKAAGNYDGTGLTWGIIGFTLKSGEVQAILEEIRDRHPNLIDEAFGPLRDSLLDILAMGRVAQIRWAGGLSRGKRKTRLEPAWEAAFQTLGTFPEVQEVQLRRVERYWEIARRDAGRFGLTAEPGMALCFDIAVQNGGINFDNEGKRIQQWLDTNPAAQEGEIRVCIAEVVAEASRPEYVEDVQRRKATLATGEGTLHGARYRLADWGILE